MLHRISALAVGTALLLGERPAQAQAAPPSANLLRATAGVPVFVPVGPGGNLLVGTPPGGGKPVVAFFLRRGMAESYVENIRTARAEMANILQVQASSLAELLRAQPPSRNYELAFVADPAQVDYAVRELAAQGKPSTQQGVPVFLLRSPKAGYVTISQGGRSVIPAFLGFAEVALLRDQVSRGAGAGGQGTETVIEITTLENLLASLQASTEPLFASIVVQPSSDAVADTRR